jgi:hypothetical protein
VSHCTITANRARTRGGGLFFCNGAITDCAITGNRAIIGGGLCYCLGTISGCTISGNANAGANLCHGSIIDCTVTGNSYGGLHSCNAAIRDCTIASNSTWGSGGGLRECDGAISGCTIVGNTAGDSGAGLSDCDGLIVDCLIAGNTADVNGGGLYACNGTIAGCAIVNNVAILAGGGLAECDGLFVSCTIAHNSADVLGGGALFTGTAERSASNCIWWGNTPDQILLADGSLTMWYCDIAGGWPGAGNIDADPLFADPNNEDYLLLPGSPCIDAACNWGVFPDEADLDDDGDTEELTPLDLDGEGRFFDDPNAPDTGCGNAPIVDMGAYEFGGTDLQACFGDLDDDREVDLGDLATLLSHYGETNVCAGDLDCDGDVDLTDLAELLSVYGNVCD